MPQPLLAEFQNGIGPQWNTHLVGGGRAQIVDGALQLRKPVNDGHSYTNAQIDDYQTLRRRQFLWRPPLRLTICARFSHDLAWAANETSASHNNPPPIATGTAGFGFWNDPFMMTGARWPTLPRAIWFFYSAPPSNMPLAMNVPGWGWKAATIDAWRWPFGALAPLAPVAMPLMRLNWFYRRFWPIGQRAIGVSERLIDLSTTVWRTYVIEWRQDSAHFQIDGETVLSCPTAPGGPLGLVIWIDNQYMVVTPWGALRSGLVATTAPAWLEIARVAIEVPIAI
ncbi:MAG: hypothetical protein R2911_44550 [Caldilineaceae bacterium]